MEPLAPGTEDDPPISLSSLTKKETEEERLLKIKAILPSGKYGNVFELNYVNGAEHWFCHACKCPVMGRVYQHENGRRHSINLAMMNRHEDKFTPHVEYDEPALQVAPGEPLPPGFEGEIEKTAQIQERLDNFKVGPLVALEYLLELQDYDLSKEPLYLCILCDKRGDPRTVLTHLASYNHISQYLQKHFPTCYRALAPYMTKQYKRNWQTTLQKLAEAIEQKYGRMKPTPVEKDKFEKERMNFLQVIVHGRHFSEQMGYTFEELIIHEELTKIYEDEKVELAKKPNAPAAASWVSVQKPFKKRSPSPPVVAKPKKVKTKSHPVGAPKAGNRRRSLSSVSSISSSDLSDFESGRKVHPNSRNRSPSPKRYRSPSPRRDKSRLPWQKSNYARQGSSSENSRGKLKSDKIDEYKKLAKAIENDMDKTMKHHEKNPEKHPQYNDEWKKFWNKRYKELQADGVDASKHDFKPEWIKFWNKRMAEIHQEEIKARKDALRKRLGLPEEPAPIRFRIGGSKPSLDSPTPTTAIEKKPLPMAAQPDLDTEVIIIEDKDEETKSSKRSHSPWEVEPAPKIHRSRERSRDRRSFSRERSSSVERPPPPRRRNTSKEHLPELSRDRRSSRDRYLSKSPKERRRSRSRSRERYVERKRGEYRESSYERDMRGKERVRVVSDLPWEREKAYRQKEYEEYYKPPPVMRDVTRAPVLSPGAKVPIVLPDEEEDSEINVVSVLRLLTALEERLGSLGPKVIDLLAQALALEKHEANSSDNLLDNDINCVLFETVKEKLKGQLLAGLVDVIQERAFKRAIKKTASLIHMASERKREKERNQPKVDPVKVPGVGTVDKAAIAKQIANALILQGKTDVSQEELEQLINAVVGMAEASKASNKPITTASFLEQMNASNSSSSNETNPPSASKTKSTFEPPPTITSQTEEPNVRKERSLESFTLSPSKDKPSTSSSTSNMDHLSDSDLQTLLQNFKDLSTEEQHGLINYLKKLEAHEPERVERLRKFVNLGSKPAEKSEVVSRSGRSSPFSHREGNGVNPAAEEERRAQASRDKQKDEKPPVKISLDSEEEEDYSFDDVVKSVSKNVKAKELEKERKLVEDSMKFENNKKEVDLSDAKALISNLMSNISKSNSSNNSGVNLLGLGGSKPIITASAEFTKTLNSLPINMDNLANIVGNVQKIQQDRDQFNLQGITDSETKERMPMMVPKPNVRPMGTGPIPRPVQYPLKQMYGNYSQPQGFPNPSMFGGGNPRPTGFDPRNRFQGNPRMQGNFPQGNQFNRNGPPGGNFNNSNNRW